MSIPIHEKNRKILPRWRDFDDTLDQRELAGGGGAAKPTFEEGFLEEKIDAWRRDATITTASELISSSLVFGKIQEGIDAAKFVLKVDSVGPLRRMAEDLLSSHEPRVMLNTSPQQVSREFLSHRVRTLRAATRRGPRDPIAWLDLAHAYSSLGLTSSALRPIETAIALAPTNRFVARGAARFFVHIGDSERAAAWLASRANLESDPWILAAEIATASLAGKTSGHERLPKKAVDGQKWSESEVTELASALGTLELEAGNAKGARKLFRLSLVQPSDNSVAQAEWAERRGHVSLLSADALSLPRTFEARAKRYLSTGRFSDAVRDSWNWLRDESFSREPAAFGSYVASMSDDNVGAEQLLTVSLIANPHDALLLNNLAFSLASRGLTERAEQVLSRAQSQTLGKKSKAAITATAGLIQFRKGRFAEGQRLYKAAIEDLRSQSEDKAALLAQLLLAREEKLARVPGFEQTVTAAENAVKGRRDPEILLVASRLRDKA